MIIDPESGIEQVNHPFDFIGWDIERVVKIVGDRSIVIMSHKRMVTEEAFIMDYKEVLCPDVLIPLQVISVVHHKKDKP